MARSAEEYEKLIEKCIGYGDVQSLRDGLMICKGLEKVDALLIEEKGIEGQVQERVVDQGNFDKAHALARRIRGAANALVKRGGGQEALELYYSCHLFDAPYWFDSFCIYIEKDREPEKKFYMPRRKQLLPLAEALQDLEDGKLYLLGISLPPGAGKTTLAEFFLAWECGKHPELSNLIGSHSYPFVDGMYSEMLRLFDPLGEYRWKDVFPEVRVINQSARMRMIDLGHNKKEGKRFMTLEFGTLGSSLAGRVRAMNLLYCDDLVDGIETALSRERMDKLWQQYYTDLRQRKIGDRCKELHIATRWSVHDVLGRLEQEYAGDEYARFISVPAMDENGESNFDYPYGLGYTTEDLKKQMEIMDDASWKALFMNCPIEREGILYHPDELRRFFKLPEQEPDAILAICDTKEQGSDYCAMPVFFQYSKDFYLEDVIYDNGKVEVVEERVARKLVDMKVQKCRIESNRGGTLFAQNVQKRIEEMGGITTITTKWTQTNKETRIEINSGYIKAHVLFKAESELQKNKEYRTAMTQLCSYTITGKNKNDDFPDVLSMFVDFVSNSMANKVQILKRPF
jgi:predicted phage terminase large subunit-like protein